MILRRSRQSWAHGSPSSAIFLRQSVTALIIAPGLFADKSYTCAPQIEVRVIQAPKCENVSIFHVA